MPEAPRPPAPAPAPPRSPRPTRVRWLAFLSAALREITAAPTVDAALGSMVDMLVAAFELERVAYFEHDARAGVLRVSHRGGRYSAELSWPLDAGVLGIAARGRQTVVTADVRTSAGYVAHFPDTASELTVPLVEGDELIGVLDIQACQPRFFSATAVEVVEAVAAQAVAVRRVLRLRQEQARRIEEQRAVHEVSLAILEALPWEDCLRRVVTSARALLGGLGASVGLVDAETGDMVVELVDGLEIPVGTRLPAGSGLHGRVVSGGEPLAVDDYATWQHRVDAGWTEGWHAAAGVPLRVGADILGSLVIVSDAPAQRYDDADVRLLERLAAAAALAIRNAVQTAERHADLRAVAGVARTLSTETDAASIRQAIVDVASRVMGASITTLFEPDGRGHLRVTAGTDQSTHEPVSVDDPLAATARAFRTAEPVFLGDALGDSRASQALVRRAGARAFHAQPVVRDGITLGVLVSVWDRPRVEVSERVRTLLALLATDAAVAIARAHLVEWLDGMARRDALTGAANRRAWDEELPRRLAAAAVDDEPLCLAMLDIDLFKAFNDVQGHQRGDALLRRAVAAWSDHLGDRDLLARYGGEEFALLLVGRDPQAAREIVERVRAVVPDGQTCSAGLAAWDGEESAESLVARADAALYEAKHAGRDRCVVAAGDGTVLAPGSPLRTAWTRWTAAVPRLLQERAVRSAYQPVLRLERVGWQGGAPRSLALAIAGYEALARVGPTPTASASVEGLFAAAQYRGLSADMDWLCRRAALAGAAGMPAGAALFVNVGVSTLLDPLHGIDQMDLLLSWAGREPGDVVLEITEREAVRDAAALRRTLDMYRERGYRFAVDDVGEGHSTLEVLAAATPEFVKIARTLVATCEHRGPRAAILSVVAFARGCGAEVVAEGIESRLDLERVRELGVGLGQGYGLERPSFQPTGFAECTLTASA